MEQIINARGWECPKPIIETKKLLDLMKEGQVTTIVDNKIAVDNLIAFSKSLGYEISCEEKENAFFMTVIKECSEEAEINQNHDVVIQISTNQYGSGAEELGKSLMKAYIYALTEATPLPQKVMFINSGVFLTTEGSEVLDSLQELEEMGVEILSCGACLNYYGLSENLKVGNVTNMYSMVDILHHAGNAIKI